MEVLLFLFLFGFSYDMKDVRVDRDFYGLYEIL